MVVISVINKINNIIFYSIFYNVLVENFDNEIVVEEAIKDGDSIIYKKLTNEEIRNNKDLLETIKYSEKSFDDIFKNIKKQNLPGSGYTNMKIH